MYLSDSFITNEHRRNFTDCYNKAFENGYDFSKNVYVLPLIYLLSFEEFKNIEHYISLETLNINYDAFTESKSGTTNRIKLLAYSLYSNSSMLFHENKENEIASIVNIFDYLDEDNFQLCLNAISLRYKEVIFDI